EQVLTLTGKTNTIEAERLRAIAERAKTRYNFRVDFIDPKQLERFADDFRIVYNAAFGHFEHFKPLKTTQVLDLFAAAKPIMDPKLVVVAYLDDQPVGFCALLPDINPALKHAKGKLNLWSLPRFLWKLRFAKNKVAKGVAFGIHPEHQRKGVFAIMVDKMYIPHNVNTYPTIALATIRGHNEMMIKTTRALGVTPERVHIHYRKLLDDSIVLEPFPFLEI
ncbi:MAG: hypothetical protein AAF828_08020, partial [Bacteroidota bacterium]